MSNIMEAGGNMTVQQVSVRLLITTELNCLETDELIVGGTYDKEMYLGGLTMGKWRRVECCAQV